MMDAVLNLVRPAVREMAAYKSARSLGLKGTHYLDANESPWHPLSGEFSKQGLNRYPAPQPAALVESLAAMYGVNEDSLIVGRGADDAIDWITRAFCEAREDAVIICPPTYGMYEVSSRLQGAEIAEVPTTREEGFQPNVGKILDAVTPKTKLVFICSPNNPTGDVVPFETIERLAKALWGKSVLVLDEAYIEFSAQTSFAAKLKEFPNVIVLRTLSKAYGLAGARCGVALAHPEIIQVLQKVRAPYPISFPALETIEQALAKKAECADRVRETIARREVLRNELSKLTCVTEIFPSQANFLLLQTKSARDFVAACLESGVVVRDRSRDAGLADCVRITVGSPEENEALLRSLK